MHDIIEQSETIVTDRRGDVISPDLTVIIPVYNTADYVLRTLTSLRVDSDLSIEIIIVDDGSTDHSLQVVVDWVDRYDSKALVITQNNKGLSEARNTGLRYARGQYIAFCDSDDWLNFSVVCRAVSYANMTHADIVLYRSEIYDDYSQKVTPFYDHLLWERTLNGASAKVINASTHPDILTFEPNTNCRIMRKSFFDRHIVSFEPDIHYEDVSPHITSLLNADRIGIIDAIGYYYRVNRNGKITLQRNEKRFDILKIAEEKLAHASLTPLSQQQNYAIVSVLVKMIYWCGGYTRSSTRKRYYQQSSLLFGHKNKNNRLMLLNAQQTSCSLKEVILMHGMLSTGVSFIAAYSSGQRNALNALKFMECIFCNSFHSNLLLNKKLASMALTKIFKRKKNVT